MVQKIKNNNLAEYRAFQEEKNKELVLKSIKYIKSLNGIINFSTVSQVTYDIADPLKNEKGLTLAGLSKNKLYRSLIEKAKLSQNIDINLKSNRDFYENSSNSNMTVADIKLQLHELRVKNVNLKMENKILSEQMKTLSSTVSTVEPVSDINANASIVIENDSYLTLGGGLNMMGTNILSSYYMTGNIRKFENLENELINNYNIKREEIKLGFFEGNFFVEIKSGQQLIYKHLFNLL